ncbi:hypothetical protein BJL90_00820 [Clostridium formicaceticum]|uniref:Transporter n=1 Tax=Clostridium formicaceticum TaxID=1497 RepID=A0ABM6EYR7_9CLOT|nr:hypothetical protein BJL90_00820 [Clostridium formicaceticum]
MKKEVFKLYDDVNYNQPPYGRPPFGPTPGFPQPPVGPPPPFDDFQQPYAVDPGAIRFCLFRFTTVELIDRRRFTFFPVFVGPTSVAGWQHTRRGWSFIGIDLREIRFFSC